MLKIYTDGACRVHSDKKGSCGFVILDNAENIIHEDASVHEETTSIEMELRGVINALEYFVFSEEFEPFNGGIHVYSDSQYLVKGINEWVDNWVSSGWKTASRKPVQHADLWRVLLLFRTTLQVHFIWVPGHAGNKWNEYVHNLIDNKLNKK